MPQVVAVEQVGGPAGGDQPALQLGRRRVDLPEPDSPVSHTVMPCVARSARCTEPLCQTTLRVLLASARVIMPAATVLLVASSMRMKLPVSRLRR